MAATTTRDLPKNAQNVDVDSWIVPDRCRLGRHNAVLRESRSHVWAITADLERSGWDIAAVAKSREVPEEAIRAAIAYRERYRELFDADQLLRR